MYWNGIDHPNLYLLPEMAFEWLIVGLSCYCCYCCCCIDIHKGGLSVVIGTIVHHANNINIDIQKQERAVSSTLYFIWWNARYDSYKYNFLILRNVFFFNFSYFHIHENQNFSWNISVMIGHLKDARTSVFEGSVFYYFY